MVSWIRHPPHRARRRLWSTGSSSEYTPRAETMPRLSPTSRGRPKRSAVISLTAMAPGLTDDTSDRGGDTTRLHRRALASSADRACIGKPPRREHLRRNREQPYRASTSCENTSDSKAPQHNGSAVVFSTAGSAFKLRPCHARIVRKSLAVLAQWQSSGFVTSRTTHAAIRG